MCDFCEANNLRDRLDCYRPKPVDDWDDYIRVIKLAVEYAY